MYISLLSLMLSFVLLPLFNGGIDHQVIYWVLFLLLPVFLICSKGEKLKVNLEYTSPLFWYSLFTLWGGISIAWSLDIHCTLVEFLQLICYGIIYFLTAQLDEFNLLQLGRIAWLAGVGAAFWGINQFLFLSPERVSGTFANPNPFSIYLVMLFFLGWGYGLHRLNFGTICGSLVILTAVFLTGSRGSLVAFLFALAFLFWDRNRENRYKKAIKTIQIVFVALLLVQAFTYLAVLFQDLNIRPALDGYLFRTDTIIDSSSIGRLAFWKAAVQLAVNKPFMGYGLGTFYSSYHLGSTDNMWFSRYTHNHYLQTLAELGLIGFGFLVMFLICAVQKIKEQLQSQSFPAYFPGMVSALVAFIVHIGIDFSWNFPGTAVIFFAIAGGITGITPFNFNNVHRCKTFTIAVAIISTMIFLLAACQYSSQLLFQQAVKFSAAGDYKHAALLYNRAIIIYPVNYIYYYHAARNQCYLALADNECLPLDGPIMLLQRAARFNPTNSTVHSRLGKLHAEAGNMAEAEEHLFLAVEHAGYRIGNYLDLGWFYIQQGRLEEAETVLRKALALENVALKRSKEEPYLAEHLNKLYLLLEELYCKIGQAEDASH